MRFINSISGTVALHVSGDEVAPLRGINQRDFIEFIGNAYNFASKPQLLPPPLQTLEVAFQSGTFVQGNERFLIMQLLSASNGDIVTAITTDIAEAVLNDYIEKLNAELGYRFSGKDGRRLTYQSNIVVQFDGRLEEKIKGLKEIESILAKEMPRSVPFNLKKLTFGHGNPIVALTLDNIENSDFSLERRGNELYSGNKYFCSAPVPTSEHIRIIEVLERNLSA
jgi:hypothetical protein